MGNYIPFTEQQREQARRTDLAALLQQCGEKIKRSGTEFAWLDHGQKVTIRGNLWYHQYEQVGGDAVDFACRFYCLDYPEAVNLLLGMGVPTVKEAVEPFPQTPFSLPPKLDNMHRVYGYLIRCRGIAKEVLDAFAYHSTNYWESASRALDRRFGLTVSAILEDDANAHFSVFPLAPIAWRFCRWGICSMEVAV